MTRVTILTRRKYSSIRFPPNPTRIVPRPRYVSTDASLVEGPRRSKRSFTERYLPTIMQPKFWSAMIPKRWRESSDDGESSSTAGTKKAKGWNPATFYIIALLIISSHGIRMGALRNEYTQFTRKADAKIAHLKDIMDRVQRGEQVDVEAELGRGKVEEEQAWEDVLREIAEDEEVRSSKSRTRKQRRESQQPEVVSSNSTGSND